MDRIILVEALPLLREMLAAPLRDAGFEVELHADPVEAAASALARPPAALVAGLKLPRMNGAQLCRLIRSNPITALIPVFLLDGEERKGRFWARHAGASGFCTHDQKAGLAPALRRLLAAAPTATPEVGDGAPHLPVLEQLATTMDRALFEQILTSELRALSSFCGDINALFAELARLAGDLIAYHWMALHVPGQGYFHLHTNKAAVTESKNAALRALELEGGVGCASYFDQRPLSSCARLVRVRDVPYAGAAIAKLAIGISKGSLQPEDEAILALMLSELGGVLNTHLAMEQIRSQAATDALTGLMNRRSLLEALEHEYARSCRQGTGLALLMMDMDHFKAINDTLGHATGDKVLQGVARLLREKTRASDLCARWGGEEFIVAMPETSLEGAMRVAERLRAAIPEAWNATGLSEPRRVTASFGIAISSPGWSVESLIASADRALYAAKQNGRDRVEVD